MVWRVPSIAAAMCYDRPYYAKRYCLTDMKQHHYLIRHWRLGIVWLCLGIVLIVFFAWYSVDNARHAFELQATSAFEAIYARVRDNEAVLEGLAAHFDPRANSLRDEAVTYAASMLQRFPHIYMLEAARRVEASEVPKVEAAMQAAGFDSFRIRASRYAMDRRWQAVPQSEVYYPLVFLFPMTEEVRPILGLDIFSVPHLRQAAERSISTGRVIASSPFVLAEGGRGYVSVKAAPILSFRDPPELDQNNLLALLVVHVSALLPEERIPSDAGILLYHGAFEPDDPEGILERRPAKKVDWLAEVLFSRLDYQRQISLPGHPFVLRVEQALGWDVIDRNLAVLLASMLLLSAVAVVMYARTASASTRVQAKAKEVLIESEARYRGLFEESPISLWEEDFSEVKAALDELTSSGVTDIGMYLREHPEFVTHCIELVKVVDVNAATLALYGAEDKETFKYGISSVLGPGTTEVFMQGLIALSGGQHRFQRETTNCTFSDQVKHIALTWLVPPGHEATFSRVLVSIIDITPYKEVQQALRYRIELEHLIATLSTHFINLPPQKVDPAIDEGLELLGRFAKVDRSYVFQYCDDGTTFTHTHEWCAAGIPPTSHRVQRRPVKDFPWFNAQISNGQVVHIPDVAELPLEASPERAEFEHQDIQSMICVPLTCSGKILGFVGFDSVRETKEWSDDSIALLRIIGEVFANAIERNRIEESLLENRERLLVAIEASEEGYFEHDTDSHRMIVSERGLKCLGFRRQDVPGSRRIEHWWARRVHADDRKRVFSAYRDLIEDRTRSYDQEYRLRHHNGTWCWIRVRAAAVKRDREGRALIVAGTAADLTTRREAEEQLKASLREKEYLLQEIHHRVKNNLNIISSLLALQSYGLEDPLSARAFRDTRLRVHSMALVHEKLYGSNDLAHVDFGGYVKQLIGELMAAYALNGNRIKVDADVGTIALGIDQAIPCGLILNELIANALQHAFADGRAGMIHIHLRPVGEDGVMLRVADNGIGIRKTLDWRNPSSMGLQLVVNLSKQLGAELRLERAVGTEFRILFERTKA